MQSVVNMQSVVKRWQILNRWLSGADVPWRFV